MTYFRRATVYLAMGKSKSALPDLDKVIELKQDFTAVGNHEPCGNILTARKYSNLTMIHSLQFGFFSNMYLIKLFMIIHFTGQIAERKCQNEARQTGRST